MSLFKDARYDSELEDRYKALQKKTFDLQKTIDTQAADMLKINQDDLIKDLRKENDDLKAKLKKTEDNLDEAAEEIKKNKKIIEDLKQEQEIAKRFVSDCSGELKKGTEAMLEVAQKDIKRKLGCAAAAKKLDGMLMDICDTITILTGKEIIPASVREKVKEEEKENIEIEELTLEEFLKKIFRS